MGDRPVTPLLAADGFVPDAEGRLLLVKRRNPPFQGSWALPGGFVELEEAPPDACVREVKEETGLEVAVEKLGGVWGRPGRDPRYHTVSTVYLCRIAGGTLGAGDDAAEARFFTVAEIAALPLAFDHREILDTLLR